MKRWMSLSLSTIIIIIWSNSKIPMRIILTIIISRWRSSWRVCMFPRTQLQRSLQGRSWRRHFRKWRSALMRSRHIGSLWSQWSSWSSWSSPDAGGDPSNEEANRPCLLLLARCCDGLLWWDNHHDILIYRYLPMYFFLHRRKMHHNWLIVQQTCFKQLYLTECCLFQDCPSTPRTLGLTSMSGRKDLFFQF